MTANVYRQHYAAFSKVSAYVILHNGERVATVAIKYPRDGAGRLYAYVHYVGVPMVRAFAGGFGYDKRTAAVRSAVRKIDPAQMVEDHWKKEREACEAFTRVMRDAPDGQIWSCTLQDAGYNVLQAV